MLATIITGSRARVRRGSHDSVRLPRCVSFSAHVVRRLATRLRLPAAKGSRFR